MISTYRVTGTAGPVVVLMSGAGMKLRYWDKVAFSLSSKCRVVTYERVPPKERSPYLSGFGGDQIEDLLELLTRLELPPPYYLVGHSLGGLYAQLVARYHPDLVAGVVLADATHPKQDARLADTGDAFVRFSRWLARIWDKWLGPGIFTEVVLMADIGDEIASAPAFPNIPLTVITAGKRASSWLISDRLWNIHLQNQYELAALTTHSHHVIANNGGHNIPADNPKLISEAITEMFVMPGGHDTRG